MHYEADEWTAAEREALGRLPREEDPGRLLEERTVAALRERGLLRGAAREGRGGRLFRGGWWAAAVAAGLALFLAGLATGEARGRAAAQDLVTALRTAGTAERPALVQEAGSLYVDAVASLASLQRPGEEAAVGTGVEVGLAALHAAAYEMARLHPEDDRIREILRALESPVRADTTSPDVHWF